MQIKNNLQLSNQAFYSKERVFGLDILRAVAIFFVMISHGNVYSMAILDIKYYSWLLWDGVSLFFVLSGFLIGGILIKLILEQDFNFNVLLQFLKRRWLRTMPNYYLILTLLIGFYFVSHHQMPPLFWQYYTFTQCFASPHPKFFAEAWSLAVEEWFYFMIPLALFYILKFKGNKKNQIALVIWAVLIFGTSVRIIKASQIDPFNENNINLEISKQVITRIDSIMYGMIGAWFFIFKNELFLKCKNILFFIGMVILFGSVVMHSYSRFFHNYFYTSTIAIGALFLLPKLSTIKTGSGLLYQFITFISIISYSIYLINHMLIQRGLLPLVIKYFDLDLINNKMNNLLLLVLFWIFTLLFSFLLYRFWEQPMLKLRQKI